MNRQLKAGLVNQLRGVQHIADAQEIIYFFFREQTPRFETFLLNLNFPVAETFDEYIRGIAQQKSKKGAKFSKEVEDSIRLTAEESAQWMTEGYTKTYQSLAAKDESYKLENIETRFDDEINGEDTVVTQVASTSNLTALDVAEDFYSYKQWNAIIDERTRDTHLEADGQIVGMDDLFAVGLELMMHPGDMSADPGEWVNCRCSMIFVDEEDIVSGYIRPEGD